MARKAVPAEMGCAFPGKLQPERGTSCGLFGAKDIAAAGKFEGYAPLLVEIARFFKTGRPPLEVEQTLEIYAFMEAADESKRQGGGPVTLESVLAKARAAAGAK